LKKKSRHSEDEPNTLYVANQILQICYEKRDWEALASNVAVIAGRRSQFRRVVMRMVQHVMVWMEECDKEIKKKLIDALIRVTEGKIFVEVERARLTRKKAEIFEQEGAIATAADILQQLQIETFGSMMKREKCDFMLEQMRLCLANRDFMRANIVRNKITNKILSNLKDLEIKYWNLSLILFYHYNSQYLELAKAYNRLKDLFDKTEDKVSALANAIFAVVIAPHSNEQNDMLYKILQNETKLLESLPVFRELLVLLTTWELIGWPLPGTIHETLTKFQFVGVVDKEQNFSKILQDRIVQHNIRVIAKYYSRISSKRLAQFLSIPIDDTEKYLSELVNSGIIFARVDRLEGVIRFRAKETSNDILNEWKSSIDKLLDLVDSTCHQVNKEMVIHSAKNKRK